MKRAVTALDRLVILCRDIQKTSAIYCETLGLKTVLQSPQLIELKDTNNFRIFLKTANKPFQLSKGYSPILSFKIQKDKFEEVKQKLLKWKLMQDGEVIETKRGRLVNFQGPQGQHISINNFEYESEQVQEVSQQSKDEKSSEHIKNLLSKIKI